MNKLSQRRRQEATAGSGAGGGGGNCGGSLWVAGGAGSVSMGGSWDERRGGGSGWDSGPELCRPRREALSAVVAVAVNVAGGTIATAFAAVFATAVAGECDDRGNRKAIVSSTSRVTNASRLFLRLLLRNRLRFPALPATAVGGKRLTPERDWQEGGWGGRTRRIPCGPLPT